MLEEKFWSKTELQHILNGQHTNSLYISFVNPFSYYIFVARPDLVRAMDGFFVDGALLKTLHNITNAKRKVERISFDFSSIAHDMFEFAAGKRMTVALVGGSREDIATCNNNLRIRYPHLNIVYTRHGFFNSKDDIHETVCNIIELKASLVVVGMGVPLQEEFLQYLRMLDENKEVKFALTCGGFITQTAIRPDYYLPIVKKLGLRWLQRIIMHRHVRRRVVRDYPIFLFKYIKHTIASRI